MHSRWLQSTCLGAIALVAALLAGCGGGGDADRSRSGGDAASVRADVVRGLKLAGDDACRATAYATQRFVDQLSYSIPEYAAISERLCRADRRHLAAHAVEVSRLRVDGDRATARVTARGGAYDFGDLDVALVRDGVWKLDRMTGLQLDRERFNRLQVELADIGSRAPTKEQVDCSLRRFARFSDAELERAVLRSDVTLASDPVLVCFLRPELRAQGLSNAQVGCIVKELRRQGRTFLRVLFREDVDETAKLLAAVAQECAAAITA